MDGYLTWNNALARRFFHPDVAGTPVYFFVTDDVIAEVGQTIGRTYEDFLAAVRAGPLGVSRSGHCQRALQIAEGWRDRGLEYPPYLAYLALFVLAAGHEGGYAPQAYYPNLWSLLGENRTHTLPSFKRMLELWDDLEQWSVRDRGGDLGVFEARNVGGRVHVGLPLAQTILTETERDALPFLFSDARLDPARPATSRELRRALIVHGNSYLQPRTMRAFDQRSETFQEAIVDAVAEDFAKWDGSVPTSVDRAAGAVVAGLRLCLAVDRVRGTTRASLRISARRPYPEEPLRIAGLASEVLECSEFYGGWSTPLRPAGSEYEHEPDLLAWESGLAGTDERTNWRVRLEQAQVRVFVEGKASMLPGLVEALELPRDAPFYLAFNDTAADRIGEWLKSDCVGWTPIHIEASIPPGWTFGTVDRASSDGGVSDIRPGLGHTDRITMVLVGGVRAARGNTFFSFAPPRLAIHGATESHQVRVNGLPVESGDDSTLTYGLPDNLPTDSRIVLEILDGDDLVRRSALYLVSGISWQFEHLPLTVDAFGRPEEDGSVCGAAVPEPPAEQCPQDLLRTPGLSSLPERVYFVGRHRGEIAIWPDEPPPPWQAVWAVPFRRRGQAIFCGSSLANSTPLPERAGNRSRRKLWHDLLWRRRKQITPPADRAQKSLWGRYGRAARDR